MLRTLFFALLILCILAFSPSRPSDAASDATSDAKGGHAATAGGRPLPFEGDEELTFECEFSKLFLRGIKIAEFKFTAVRGPAPSPSVTPASAVIASSSPIGEQVAARTPLLFTGDITSKGWFRKIFGINFHYHVESSVEPASFAVLRTTKLDEQGKRVRASEAVFNRAENRIIWTERDPNDGTRPPRTVTSPLDGASHDIISAIYFLRTQKLTPGEKFQLVVSDSGVVYRIPVKVLAEPNKMKSVLGSVPVVRVDFDIFGEQRPISGKGRMSLWLTSDARRIPVRAHLSSDMGTIEIKLKSVGAPSPIKNGPKA